jgi:hypothetical protein
MSVDLFLVVKDFGVRWEVERVSLPELTWAVVEVRAVVLLRSSHGIRSNVLWAGVLRALFPSLPRVWF